MVYETPTEETELTEDDWTIVGKRERRIIVYLPDQKEGLHTVARHLSELANQLHEIPRAYPETRAALVSAGAQIQQTNLKLKQLKADWDTEFQRREERRQKTYADVVGIKSSKSV